MKRLVLFLACCLGLTAYTQTIRFSVKNPSDLKEKYWQQEVNYDIDVRLNQVDNSLDGFVKIRYVNHSPDTLRFIWLQLWANAYKNDKTAFSDQLLENGRTDFYFSNPNQRGYINHLDFRINGIIAAIEDHPEFIDIIKLILPGPLAPDQAVQISTPFHEKLPFAYIGSGYSDDAFQITKWYPQPAVYDREGWHPMPLLEQGEQYSEYGDFNVRITVPDNFVVATTGDLQDEREKKWLGTIHHIAPSKALLSPRLEKSGWPGSPRRKINRINDNTREDSTVSTKTLHYLQYKSSAFSWFASRDFVVGHDTLQLASGRIIDVYSFSLAKGDTLGQNSIKFIKNAVRFHTMVLGEFPYNTISVVETGLNKSGALEYPEIPNISSKDGLLKLDFTIEHGIGHYWFQNIFGTDGRRNPWMTEGMNAYYDRRYLEQQYPGYAYNPFIFGESPSKNRLQKKWPENPDIPFMDELIKEKLDQPMSTAADTFSHINYHFIVYVKTGLWMKQMEGLLGVALFDSCIHEYFKEWRFKHPTPADFKSIFEKTAGQNLNEDFELIDRTGPLLSSRENRTIQPVFLFSTRNAKKINYIGIGPAAGYNLYDQLMVGVVIHNYNLPSNNFQFLLTPLYAIGSKQLNGIGRISYSWYPDDFFRKVEIGLGGSRFSTLSGIDSNGNKIFGGFEKVVPFMRWTAKNLTARSTLEKWVEFKIFGIGEKGFNYVVKSTDSNASFPSSQKYITRYLNQLTFHVENYRELYPFDVQFQFQQGSEFYRLNLCSHYFFNYSEGGGMNFRFFAAKFGYIGENTSEKEFDTSPFQPKLTASRGYLNEDYTYSNYFLGRSEYSGFASQQIMMKDGGLKIRTDLFQDLQGRSDNWIAAMNFNTTLPAKILPPFIPLRIFADIGTYAGAWANNSPTSKFLYVGGLQLTFLKGLINFYAPIIYSSDFSNNLKTVPEENTFWKKISFSIDIQDFDFRKIVGNMPFKNER